MYGQGTVEVQQIPYIGTHADCWWWWWQWWIFQTNLHPVVHGHFKAASRRLGGGERDRLQRCVCVQTAGPRPGLALAACLAHSYGSKYSSDETDAVQSWGPTAHAVYTHTYLSKKQRKGLDATIEQGEDGVREKRVSKSQPDAHEERNLESLESTSSTKPQNDCYGARQPWRLPFSLPAPRRTPLRENATGPPKGPGPCSGLLGTRP